MDGQLPAGAPLPGDDGAQLSGPLGPASGSAPARLSRRLGSDADDRYARRSRLTRRAEFAVKPQEHAVRGARLREVAPDPLVQPGRGACTARFSLL
jgi:hypothetical protein